MFIEKQVIELNHLYRLTVPCSLFKINYKPYIYVNTGTVDLYASGAMTQPTSISDMTIEPENQAVDGFDIFELIPEYICVKANEGAPTEIVLAGLKATDLGEIA